jgi:hypothetical protein
MVHNGRSKYHMSRSLKLLLAAVLVGLAAIFLLSGRQVVYGSGPGVPQQVSDIQRAVSSSPDDTISLTQPAPNTVIAESDDYATQVLGNPWDMTTTPPGDLRNLSGLDDLTQPYLFTAPTVSNGIWSANTTAGVGSSVNLQYQDFANAYSALGEKNGQNYPISSTRFSRFFVRLYSSASFLATIYWYKNYDSAPTGNSNIFTVQPGWNVYSVDLRPGGGGGSGNWTQAGPYTAFMFQEVQGAAGINIQFDWARLTPDTAQTVRILWSYSGSGTDQVHLYLSTSPTAGTDNELQLATVAASAGAYSWNTTGIAPGSYYIHAELNGAVSSIGPIVVNTAPIARIDAPSPLTGEDFAYAHLATGGWNSSNSTQFERVVNIANLVFGAFELRGRPTNGDPQLLWLSADPHNHIDTSRYRYFSQMEEIDPPAGRPDAPFNSGPRLIWDDGSHTYPVTNFVLWRYRTYEQRFWDLPNTPMVNGSWSGQLNYFRLDPNEDDDSYGRPPIPPASFGLTINHLTTVPIAGRAGVAGSGLYGTVIRWTPMQGGGTISLYRDTTNSGYNGVPIATGLPLSQGYYDWDTSQVPAGTYYVYEVVTDGTNSTRSYSLAPILVDQSQPSTLFSDVPNNYWAVDYINRLAMRNIVGGTFQSDTTVNFTPANTASRAQLSKIVVLAAGWTLLNPSSATFADVAPGSTFYEYVETAASHGVISGYACGGAGEPCDPQGRNYFRPNSHVTRGQTAKMVSISRGWTIITPATPTFEDVPYDGTPGALYSYIETAVSKGIISGYACGGAGEPCDPQQRPYYRPGNSVTRAQLSKMVSTALDVP